ncbi:helix-turn-helix domain-containing protein [Salinithrix halophila]|uniref:Helix-turn-helix domain-containing protein n=1 Tax=Salinithrix halophila TaxID=1485204 RepID=A0ABV8JH27_9BACL
MNSYPSSELGVIIRKVRKERGLRLEDLADDNISPATISNVERGVPHVSTDKALYLLKKLNIGLDQVPQMLKRKREEIRKLNFKLLGVESLFSNGKWEKALEILHSLELEDSHLLAPKAYYLKGKCLIKAKRWKKAERELHKAIQLASQQADVENIEAAGFNELAIIYYSQNDLENALQFIESGIDAFDTERERQYLYYLLTLNKAIFLERLGRLNESMNVVTEVWDSLYCLDESDTVLTFYWLRSELLRRLGQHRGAEEYVLEGIDIARRNSDFNLLFDLWTVMGSSYINQEKWDEAEFCFEQALSLDGVKEHKFIQTFSWLGMLYINQKEWNKAFPVLEKALSLGKKHNDVPRYIQAIHVMGDYYRERGEAEKAIEQYHQALELSRKHDLLKREYAAVFRLAECWEGQNKEEFSKATANMYEVQRKLAKEGAQILDGA